MPTNLFSYHYNRGHLPSTFAYSQENNSALTKWHNNKLLWTAKKMGTKSRLIIGHWSVHVWCTGAEKEVSAVNQLLADSPMSKANSLLFQTLSLVNNCQCNSFACLTYKAVTCTSHANKKPALKFNGIQSHLKKKTQPACPHSVVRVMGGYHLSDWRHAQETHKM